MQVRLRCVDWDRVLAADLSNVPCLKLAPGFEIYIMPGGLQVLLLEDAAEVGRALQLLRASMRDPFIAIDLEWRPQFERGENHPVAMMQLASSSVAVLIRTCRMRYRLPPELKEFLADASVMLLGCGWASNDERKMRHTFGIGRQHFGRFLDLQKVAESLGFKRRTGLARLTEDVLGLSLPKDKVTRSIGDWEAKRLIPHKVSNVQLKTPD
ncbi:hypothetical protein OEZ85_004238 [Tetradesmus obliquus]|uniref:3'-5' exonuclease domain-containing protein n=1 Tax=Tetradesmus obliquus TaxID=3088 RepID=A0ABY8UK12_TETOB|nr:hypothetical protein OEZ85_004238 [Tetradesmus obliquus]